MGSMLPYIAAPWILWVYIYISISLSLCQKNRQLLELRTHESCDSFGTTWFSLEDPTAQPPSGGWFLLSETDAQRLPRLAVAPRASGHWAEDDGRGWTSHICDGLYNFGWWFGTWLFFSPIYWECHHPNWRTPSFFRGVGLNHQPEFL